MLQFYQHTKTCSECGQNIPASYAQEHIKRFTTLKRSVEQSIQGNGTQTRSIVATLERLTGDLDKLRRKYDFLMEQRATATADYDRQQYVVKAAERAAELLIDAINPHIARLESAKAAVAELRTQLRTVFSQQRSAKVNGRCAQTSGKRHSNVYACLWSSE